MATPCAGVTATWNGAAFGELTEIVADIGGGLPIGRSSTFAVDCGTITISCLSSANVAESERGKRGTLVISGGGLSISLKAVCQKLQMTGKVNDVARYAATFKISKE